MRTRRSFLRYLAASPVVAAGLHPWLRANGGSLPAPGDLALADTAAELL